ncbi:beta strand repeat-containing protein [Sphingomonas sp. Sphisp140]|uniref:beta strand repeat-containing protein n=1 Tax=unclassified Sphingomonas TaxID=196159 RepID=UPI0039AFE1ED
MPLMVRAAAPHMNSVRPSRRRLWGASAGALAALLAASPALAQADQQCGPVVAGTVQCAPADDAHPTGIRYDLSAQPPQDLTVIVPPATVISTTDDETAGISISTGGGAITVSAAGSTVQTAGWRSTGVRAVTAEGNVTVEAGTVTTSGYRAEGIIADAGNGGGISITADQVSTSGEAAFGVRANTPNGDIAIHTGVVSTYGWGADAIYASTSHGNTTIETGAAYAWGGSARGIVAYASGTTTIHAESVGTSGGGYGTEADATAVTAIGTAVDVAISGGVRTNGDYATGIFARSNLQYSDAEVTPTISVSAGSVTTSGAFSDGIVALNYSEHGATNVDVGNVDTRGAASFGIYAGGNGDVSVETGNVTTLGTGSQGLHAVSFGGDITVTTGNVATSGESSHGVYAINYSSGSVTVKTGDVKTRRDYSIGIGALSLGDVSVDTDSVQVSGYGSQGIVAYSVGGSVDVQAGTVSTSGGKGTGIGAYSFVEGETAHITVGSVDTRGDYAVGALALAGGGKASIDVTGTITTAGEHSEGIAASGVALDGGDAVVINATTVITTGGGARGISASGVGDVRVNVDKVITSGDLGGGRHSTWAEGILASTYSGTIFIDAGSVETSGRGGAGIDAQANFGNIAIKADTVTTAGIHAPAIVTAAMDGWTTIEAGTVKTTGDDSEGIIARSVPMDIYSDVDRSISIKADSVATTGNRSDAVYAIGAGAIIVDAGTITTTGTDARGAYAASIYDDVRVIADSVKTTGTGATGIFALAPYADVSVEAGSVETRGEATDAIRAGGLNAAVTVQSVTVAGTDSRAVDILAAGGDAVLKAGAITGSGAGNIGAVVTSYDGDTSVQIDRITLTGADSIGIAASAFGGNLTISSGAASTTGTAIDATASGDVAITVRGATKSQGDAIVATGNNVSLTIAAGGSVSGVNGIVVSAQTYVPPEEGEGEEQNQRAAADPLHHFTLTNAGLLEGGSGYALRVDAGTATIANSGKIQGRLLLGDGDDLLTNTGLFLASADSDFGTGNDRFLNQGTVRIGAAGAPAAGVTLLGLERFENAGGTIDLSNGHAGDTLTLPKDYVGSNGARIALDVGSGTTDRLVIGGAATGSTAVLLADVGNANAVLTGQAPVALIQVGAGSSANAFTLANSDIGLVHYDLGFDAASGKFLLRNAAGTPVYRLAKLNETLANAWSRGADTVATHLAGIRDAGMTQSRALWGIFGGGSERIRQTRSINGSDTAVGYRQDEVEARIGYDFGGGDAGRPGFGLTGGYINSKVNFSGSAAHATADSFDLGGYGRLSSGRFFANGSVSVAFHSLKVVDRSLGYSDDVSGRSVGAQVEVGARFGGGAFFVEPSARLSWSHTSLDDVAALSQTVMLDSLTSVRGTFGARLGGATHLGSTPATFYAGVHYVHEFAGKNDATLFSSTASDTISGLALPDQARASIGASIGGTGPVTGFIQAEGAFGSGRRGAGGRVGIRFGF